MSQEKRVLIIDDEVGILDIMEAMMPENTKVFKAQTEEAAYKILEFQNVDAVLCDISWGRGNGLRLLERCRLNNLATPFVMITGDATNEKAILALRLGAMDVVEKPIPMEYFTTDFVKVMEEGYSLRRIKWSVNQVTSLVGAGKADEMGFVKNGLSIVEAKRLFKKSGLDSLCQGPPLIGKAT